MSTTSNLCTRMNGCHERETILDEPDCNIQTCFVIANGNNAVVINSELRLPVFTTLFNKPINNAFLRNFQLIQFFDLGNAWAGSIKNLSRPVEQYTNDQSSPFTNVTVNIPAGGIGPFAGSYGFGARSTLLGYFLRFDIGWEMNTFFGGKPIAQVSMGVDF